MTALQNRAQEESTGYESKLMRLEEWRRARRVAGPAPDFSVIEREIRQLVRNVEQEMVREELSRFDVDVPVLTINGVVHRRAVRAEASYVSLAGEMRLERTLYRQSADDPCVCPMEVRAAMRS